MEGKAPEIGILMSFPDNSDAQGRSRSSGTAERAVAPLSFLWFSLATLPQTMGKSPKSLKTQSLQGTQVGMVPDDPSGLKFCEIPKVERK